MLEGGVDDEVRNLESAYARVRSGGVLDLSRALAYMSSCAEAKLPQPTPVSARALQVGLVGYAWTPAIIMIQYLVWVFPMKEISQLLRTLRLYLPVIFVVCACKPAMRPPCQGWQCQPFMQSYKMSLYPSPCQLFMPLYIMPCIPRRYIMNTCASKL